MPHILDTNSDKNSLDIHGHYSPMFDFQYEQEESLPLARTLVHEQSQLLPSLFGAGAGGNMSNYYGNNMAATAVSDPYSSSYNSNMNDDELYFPENEGYDSGCWPVSAYELEEQQYLDNPSSSGTSGGDDNDCMSVSSFIPMPSWSTSFSSFPMMDAGIPSSLDMMHQQEQLFQQNDSLLGHFQYAGEDQIEVGLGQGPLISWLPEIKVLFLIATCLYRDINFLQLLPSNPTNSPIHQPISMLPFAGK